MQISGESKRKIEEIIEWQERSETTKENSKDIFGLWAEGFSKISKVWQESYSDLFKPWMDSSGDFFERMTDLSHATDPQKSMEFYQDWVKTYQNTWRKFFPQLPMNAGKEDVQRMMDGAEELIACQVVERGNKGRYG